METKAWYQSTSILGSIVTFVALIASIFNYQINSELQSEIVNIIIGAFGVLGSIYAILGRVKATKLIALSPSIVPIEVIKETPLQSIDISETPIADPVPVESPDVLIAKTITSDVISPTLQPIVAAATAAGQVAYNQVLTNAGVELSAQAK